MNEFGFEVVDLSGAAVGGGGFSTTDSTLQFDDANYLSLEEFIEQLKRKFFKGNKCRPKKYIPIASLRVNGDVKQEPMDNYLRANGVSSSLVKQALITPRHYFLAKNEPIPPKNEDCFKLGTFIHSAILEPGKFAKVINAPEASMSSKEGCLSLIEFYGNYIDRPLPECDDLNHKQLKGIVKSMRVECEANDYTFVDARSAMEVGVLRRAYELYGDGVLPKIIGYAKKEWSFYGVDPQTGMNVKVRPDAIVLEEDFGANIVISFKSTQASNPTLFYRDCAKFKYEVAEGMYLDVLSNVTGRNFTGCLMIVAQTTSPYQLFAFWWHAEDLQIGKYRYYDGMETIRACEESGEFKGFEVEAEEGNFGIIKGKLPAYIKSELAAKHMQ